MRPLTSMEGGPAHQLFPVWTCAQQGVQRYHWSIMATASGPTWQAEALIGFVSFSRAVRSRPNHRAHTVSEAPQIQVPADRKGGFTASTRSTCVILSLLKWKKKKQCSHVMTVSTKRSVFYYLWTKSKYISVSSSYSYHLITRLLLGSFHLKSPKWLNHFWFARFKMWTYIIIIAVNFFSFIYVI